MKLFRPYDRDGDNDDKTSVKSSKTADPKPSASTSSKGKSGPTPTREEAQAARMARLNPTPTKKEARQRERERRITEQNRQFDAVEKQPERVLARNFVDARWTISEFAMPALILLLVISMLGSRLPKLIPYASVGMWALLIAMIVETLFMWQKFKKILFQRYPRAIKRGLMMYISSRALQPRRWRRPGTVINRGDPF